MERTGTGDPARTVELLWSDAPPRRRGPAPRLSVPAVTAAAIAMADRDGLGKLTMRALATELGLASAMALYTYVPGKGELIDLMVDAAFAEFRLDGEGIRAVADANRALFRAHPWLLEIALDRPVLGPGSLRKYELELQALHGHAERDLTLTLIVAHARAHAVPPSTDDETWWAQAGPKLAEYVREDDYPLASRVGTAQGEAQGRAYDPDRAYDYGVELLERALAP